MTELRVSRRMANAWMTMALIAVAAFFAWMIREGLQSTSGQVYIRTLIPAYAVLLYVTAAALVNRRTVVASPDGLTLRNGPVPLGRGYTHVARRDIAFCYFFPVVAVGESGDSVVLWFVTGVETRSGRSVPVFGTHNSEAAARTAAQSIADAFGNGDGDPRIDMRIARTVHDDPTEKPLVRRWVAVVVSALVAGVIWEIVARA